MSTPRRIVRLPWKSTSVITSIVFLFLPIFIYLLFIKDNVLLQGFGYKHLNLQKEKKSSLKRQFTENLIAWVFAQIKNI